MALDNKKIDIWRHFFSLHENNHFVFCGMKSSTLIILFSLIITGFPIAQQTGYTSGSASVNLILPLSITAGNGDLDFGEIFVTSTGSLETIEPFSGKEFIVRGNPGRTISVMFDKVELNNYQWVSTSGGEISTLTFIPNVIEENSTTIQSGDNLTLRQNGLIGEVKLYVGGSIYIQPSQPIGDYEGLFVLSVSY